MESQKHLPHDTHSNNGTDELNQRHTLFRIANDPTCGQTDTEPVSAREWT